MRVLALASYDSFLNTARLISPYFERSGCTVELALVQARRQTQISGKQVEQYVSGTKVRWIDIESFCVTHEVADYDILLSCLEGLSTRRLMHHLVQLGDRRPLVISCYPGLVLRYALDGFSMRTGSDLLWLNCQADAESYAAMCSSFRVDASNARVFGLGALLEPVTRPLLASGPVVFFEQAVIPRYHAEREFLAAELIRLAKRFPKMNFVVKPRTATKEASLHRSWHPIEPLLRAAAQLQGGWPSNLALTSEKASTLLATASHCLTVCSTVAAEAIHAGIPTAVIGDFGAHEEYGLQYFFGSGIIRTFTELQFPFVSKPDAEWQARFIADPNTVIDRLVNEAIGLAAAPRVPLMQRPQRAEMSPELRAHLMRREGTSGALARTFKSQRKPLRSGMLASIAKFWQQFLCLVT
ncbi:hypothetical protein LJR010_004441 [Ensifer adhaerens]|uniref:DUF6716 putative glycosyltransferase n=1 Tax=Ensifer adhaerens TaxID=106592 RepID=UPI00399C1571